MTNTSLFLHPSFDRPWVWLGPLTLVLGVFALYPFVYNIWLSLHEFNSFKREFVYVGLENWETMFDDARFWRAFGVNMTYTVVCLVVQLVLGLGIAMLLDSDTRGYGFLRSVFTLPLVIPPAVVGMMFLLMEDSQFGVISHGLAAIGLLNPERPLLSSSETALVAVMLADIWQWTPFMTLIMLAGLRALPSEPYEAAVIDGAGFFQIFWRLTLPMMRQVMAVAILIRGIDLFRTFDYVFVMTSGGPGVATQTLSYYTWKQSFAFVKWGYGATLSLFALIFLIVLANVFIKAAKIRW